MLVTELLRPLDRLQGGNGPERTRWPALQLRERVLDYIDANLDDTKLCPNMIATAHGVSVRTLYSSVDGLGVSLGSYIRHRRLARSHDDLLFGSEPVAVVARRWGFASPACFSRVFRDGTACRRGGYAGSAARASVSRASPCGGPRCALRGSAGPRRGSAGIPRATRRSSSWHPCSTSR